MDYLLRDSYFAGVQYGRFDLEKIIDVCRVYKYEKGDESYLAFHHDGIYALDVLEHILPEDQDTFLGNVTASLTEHGVVIVGVPSLESQAYAAPTSKAGHVNCQTMPQLKEGISKFFHNVFMFAMNDEVVHTGYHKMAHYLLALCCGKR